MARIKVKGINDLIEVPQEDAKALRNRRVTNQIKADEQITIGSFSGENRQIAAIILDGEQNWVNRFTQGALEVALTREARLKLSPEELAKIHLETFKTLFYACTNQQPDEEALMKAQKEAEVFFAFSDNRTFPNLLIWKKIIDPYGLPMLFSDFHNRSIRALERCMAYDIEQSENVITSTKIQRDPETNQTITSSAEERNILEDIIENF